MEAEVHTQIITTDKKQGFVQLDLYIAFMTTSSGENEPFIPFIKLKLMGFFHEAYDWACAALKSLTTLKHRMDLYQIYLTAHWLCVTVGW